METLRDIRRANQDAGGRNRWDPRKPVPSIFKGRLCLPSLNGNTRTHSDGSDLVNTRSLCIPAPPAHRQIIRRVVAAAPSSSSVQCGIEPSLLSRSAPTIMEPLLGANTMSQARAHIHSRLGSSSSTTERRHYTVGGVAVPVDLTSSLGWPCLEVKTADNTSATHQRTPLKNTAESAQACRGFIPMLHPNPRTPTILAPLTVRPRDSWAPLVLKHHVPLKPISQNPLCSKAQLRKGRSSWGSPLVDSPSGKGGSEESEESESSSHSSTSSQSSSNLEEEDDGDIHERDSEDGHVRSVGESLLDHPNHVRYTDCRLQKVTEDFNNGPRRTYIIPIHRSDQNNEGKPVTQISNLLSNEKSLNCEGKVLLMNFNHQSQLKITSAQHEDTMAHIQDTVNEDIPITSKNFVVCTIKPETLDSNGTCYINIGYNDAIASSRGNYVNDQHHVKQEARTMQNFLSGETPQPTPTPTEEVKVNSPVVKKALFFTQAVDQSLSADVVQKPNKRKFKTINLLSNNERRMSINRERRGNIQSNQSLVHKDQSLLNQNKSKSNVKYSSYSTQIKTDLTISGVVARTKIKSKLKSVMSSHRNTDVPSGRKKAVEVHHLQKRNNLDQLNQGQQHLQVKEMNTSQQLKRPGAAGTLTPKSAVHSITYKDMFQPIQNEDEGPGIYEMFTSPIYDNLRVFSSCEKSKDRQVLSVPSKKIPPNHKAKHRPMKHAQSKTRSPGESAMVSAKSKPRSSKVKPALTPMFRRTTQKQEGLHKTREHMNTEVVPEDAEVYHNTAGGKAEDHKVSTTEEVHSKFGSETFRTDHTLTQAHGLIQMQTAADMTAPDTRTQTGLFPGLELSQSPQQPNINTWTSSFGNTMSPVYQRFLDEVGDGPLTDDVLQCLAEELILLDERDVSLSPSSDSMEANKKETNSASGRSTSPKKTKMHHWVSGCILWKGSSIGGPVLHGSGLSDTITWTKGEVLGRGAYGTVYCGLTGQGQLMAVKQVNLDTSDPDAAKREYSRLQGEVELLKALCHVNIVGFLGTSLYQHVVSIFMEYVPGGSIASILHRFGPLPERVLALYTQQILQGVAYLHLNRVVHRDLKGNNVMLMPTGVIKLIDFGCARRLNCLHQTTGNTGDLLKSVHGTPYWMAPEVISETGYGKKSDVWSVGCTVFEMATGKPPLAHMDKMAALFYIGAQRGLMPTLPDGFSENAKDFVKICLTSDQANRPSADQLLKHSFIPRNEAEGRTAATKSKPCCGHQQGLCG